MTETNAEKIQIAIDFVKAYKNSGPIPHLLLKEQLCIVIEQAERAQELEQHFKSLQHEWVSTVNENRQFRGALEVYAKSAITGVVARRALEGVSNDQNIET